jgi:hypothetical protein
MVDSRKMVMGYLSILLSSADERFRLRLIIVQIIPFHHCNESKTSSSLVAFAKM